jgi:hypothetical protein
MRLPIEGYVLDSAPIVDETSMLEGRLNGEIKNFNLIRSNLSRIYVIFLICPVASSHGTLTGEAEELICRVT